MAFIRRVCTAKAQLRDWKYKFVDQDDDEASTVEAPNDASPAKVAEIAAGHFHYKRSGWEGPWPELFLVRKSGEANWLGFLVAREVVPSFVAARDPGSDCPVDEEDA